MRKKLEFFKTQALGNNYILFDFLKYNKKDFEKILSKIAFLCDVHFGIGADGVIFLQPSKTSDFKFRIFNRDGSEAEMCGNGIRCLGKYIFEKSISKKRILKIETLSGEKILTYNTCKGKLKDITVNMGHPIFENEKIPVALQGKNCIEREIKINNHKYKITCVSMGNPHAVIFLNEDVENYPVQTNGKIIENSSIFPNRTNVEFVQVLNENEILIRVWERGVGETTACGTGACAAAVASVITKKCISPVTVHLKGGNLQIDFTSDNFVLLSGGAELVFEGYIEI